MDEPGYQHQQGDLETVMRGSTNEVIRLLGERRHDRSQPGRRADQNCVALVVEGGGMRGVVSGGMVSAIHQLGLTELFDFVIGTSAGALAGAYLLGRDPVLGTSIYYEDLIGREWIDFSRAIRSKPIVDLDFLIDDVMVNRKPLDWTGVISSPVPLKAVATRFPQYVGDVISDFESEAELRDVLRATARLPVISGDPVQLRGRRYIDGSEVESIPVESALMLGATHIVALLTRPKGVLRARPTRLQKLAVFPVMNRLLEGLGDAHAVRAARYSAEVAKLATMSDPDQPGHSAFVVQLPEAAPKIAQLEQNPRQLYAGAEAGARAVYEAFTGRSIAEYVGLRPIAA